MRPRTGNSIIDLFDAGMSADQIAVLRGMPRDRVKNQLTYLGATGSTTEADRHFNNIRNGSAKLIERLRAVHPERFA